MPFVRRDARGVITALQVEWAREATEYLPPESPEIQGFRGADGEPSGAPVGEEGGHAKLELRESDLEMIRVYEDLIDLLVEKNLVVFTDFPPAAQDKLLRRKQTRALLGSISEILQPEDDGIL